MKKTRKSSFSSFSEVEVSQAPGWTCTYTWGDLPVHLGRPACTPEKKQLFLCRVFSPSFLPFSRRENAVFSLGSCFLILSPFPFSNNICCLSSFYCLLVPLSLALFSLLLFSHFFLFVTLYRQAGGVDLIRLLLPFV